MTLFFGKETTKHFASLETIKKSWLRLQSGVEIVMPYSGEDEDADAVPKKVCTSNGVCSYSSVSFTTEKTDNRVLSLRVGLEAQKDFNCNLKADWSV